MSSKIGNVLWKAAVEFNQMSGEKFEMSVEAQNNFAYSVHRTCPPVEYNKCALMNVWKCIEHIVCQSTRVSSKLPSGQECRICVTLGCVWGRHMLAKCYEGPLAWTATVKCYEGPLAWTATVFACLGRWTVIQLPYLGLEKGILDDPASCGNSVLGWLITEYAKFVGILRNVRRRGLISPDILTDESKSRTMSGKWITVKCPARIQNVRQRTEGAVKSISRTLIK